MTIGNVQTYTDSALSDSLKKFLSSFKNQNGKYTYLDQIDIMPVENKTSVTVDYVDFATDDELQQNFIINPKRVLTNFSRAIKETLQSRFPEYAELIKDEISVRISNYPQKSTVRQINSKTIGKFISIKAMLTRISYVEPLAVKLVFLCPDGHTNKISQTDKDAGTKTPVVCENPSCKHRDFDMHPELSTFIDYQLFQLQELPKEVPAGQIPKILFVFVVGDLIDSARMGDIVEISGIVEVLTKQNIKSGPAIYKLRLNANHIKRFTSDNEFGEITKDDINNIESSITKITEKHATEMVINSFAPHIEGHSVIKEALILTMIGSDAKILKDGSRIRGDVNTFLLGDAGTAKTKLLIVVAKVAPRGFYTSGRGSSGVGLTASTIMDKITGKFMIEPGVCVLADQGITCIDEFDKMKPEDRSALHEVMEQQTVSIARGGLMATLNARTAVIAAANPILGKYDPYKNFTENIPSVPIPLLTRFDLKFIVRDVADPLKDEKIARHIFSTHSNDNSSSYQSKNSLDIEMFTKYLKYAKSKHPELSKEAEDKILEYYLQMRKMDTVDGGDGGYSITIRQFEGLVRLTIARAKFLLKDIADASDAERAIWLMDQMFHDAGVDVNTGKVDLNVLEGKPKSETNKVNLFMEIMRMLDNNSNGKGATENEIFAEMTASGKWPDETSQKSFFQKVLRDNMLFENTPNSYRIIP